MRPHAWRLDQAGLVKTHKLLFEEICSFENLLAAAQAAMRGKRSRPPAAAFFARIETELIALQEELLAGTYRPGSYHYFYIHDPKTRRVAAAPFRDRVVHHAIVRVLEPIFEGRFIEDSFACRKGKGTHAAMHRAHHFTKRYDYVLKCDIAQYFPSMDHAVLRGLLQRVIVDERLLDLLDRILDSHCDGTRQAWEPGGDLFSVHKRKRGLPIGNLTSQFFANIYLNPLDHFVKHELRVKGYLRYVDDFLLFGNDRDLLRAQGRVVREQVEALHLSIHPDKYRLLPTTKGVDFVGFVLFYNGRRRLRKENVRRFQRRMQIRMADARAGKTNYIDVRHSMQSWIAHAAHAQSWNLRRDLMRTI
jgi:RNA-directed DNA polymerase